MLAQFGKAWCNDTLVCRRDGLFCKVRVRTSYITINNVGNEDDREGRDDVDPMAAPCGFTAALHEAAPKLFPLRKYNGTAAEGRQNNAMQPTKQQNVIAEVTLCPFNECSNRVLHAERTGV